MTADSPAAARRLAVGCAELAVAVEASCQRQGCRADCAVARVARRVAVSAATMAAEWAAEAEDRRR